jgi:hypothetical protein
MGLYFHQYSNFLLIVSVVRCLCKVLRLFSLFDHCYCLVFIDSFMLLLCTINRALNRSQGSNGQNSTDFQI